MFDKSLDSAATGKSNRRDVNHPSDASAFFEPPHAMSMQSLIDSMDEGLTVLDNNFCIIEVNRESLRINNRTRAELIGLSHWDAFPGTEHSELGALYRKVMQDRQPGRIEVFYEWPDGRALWYELRVVPADDEAIAVFFRDITAQHIQTQRLEESNQRYRAAVEAARGNVWTNNAQGQMVGEQPAWAALTGQTFDEYQGYGWSNAVHPDDSQATISAWETAVAKRQRFQVEHRLRRHDGTWRLFAVRAVPVLDGETIREWVGIHFDITDERDSTIRFRQLSDAINEVFYIHDLDSSAIDYVSKAYEEIWEQPVSALYADGSSYLKCIHPEDLPLAEKAFALQQSGLNTDIRYRLIGKSGTLRYIHDRAFVVVDPVSGNRRAVGIAENVTKSTELRIQLERNAATFEALVSDNPFGIYVINQDFKMMHFSLGARNTFKDIHPLLGRDFGEIMRITWPEPYANEVTSQFRNTLATGEGYTNADTVEQRLNIDGVESYDWRIERITLPDGTFGVVCYYYDLSERVALEAALRQALIDKDLLMQEIDHRVRNSLAMVSGLLAMQRGSVREQETKDALSAAATRVIAISRVHERLYKSRAIGMVEFGEYIRGLCEDIEATLNTEDLNFAISVESVEVPVDIALPLGIVANELITNACKYRHFDRVQNVSIQVVKHASSMQIVVGDRGGSVCLHRDRQRISGSSAGCLVELPIWGVMQGGRSPTGVTPHIGGHVHAAIFAGRLSKYA